MFKVFEQHSAEPVGAYLAWKTFRTLHTVQKSDCQMSEVWRRSGLMNERNSEEERGLGGG